MKVHQLKLFTIIALVAIALLVACGSRSTALEPMMPSTDADLTISTQNQQQGQDQSLGRLPPQTINIQPIEQRIVLKDANLQLVVENVATTLDTITKMAEDMGGWVISSNTSKLSRAPGDDAVTDSIAIRVPAVQFTVALTRIKDQSQSVDSESVTGTDVTKEYTDLTSQLTNLQAAEKQLQTILDSATNTDDVLKIYNELVRVRGEIETTQGRINYYKQASSFSSISIVLRPPTVARESVAVDTAWSPATTVKGAFNALVNTLQGLANLLIILAVLVIPLVLVVVIPVWIVYRLLRRYGWINTQTRVAKASAAPSNTKVDNDIG